MRKQIIAVTLAVLLFLSLFPTGALADGGNADYEAARAVLTRENEIRAANGLGALVMDPGLMEGAMLRAEELSRSFSNTRPDEGLRQSRCASMRCRPSMANQNW